MADIKTWCGDTRTKVKTHQLRQRVPDIFTYLMAAELCSTDPAPLLLPKVLQDKPKAKPQPSIIDGTENNDERL